jgi:hypothetical protein
VRRNTTDSVRRIVRVFLWVMKVERGGDEGVGDEFGLGLYGRLELDSRISGFSQWY